MKSPNVGSSDVDPQTTSSTTTTEAKFCNPQFVSEAVNNYTNKWGFQESVVAKRLRLETAKHERSSMMGHPVEAAFFFGLLLQTMGAKKLVEVGVYTGYTTLVMAEALGEGGMIVALDVSDEYCSIGKKYWKEANVSNKIDLRIAPAAESMEKMLDNGEKGTYDFAFIDVDKANSKTYYELLLKLIRPNGIIAIDNVLWSGKVADDSVMDDDTVALREVSKHIHEDERVDRVLLPFVDGISLVRKK